jgi:hypothetical protein
MYSLGFSTQRGVGYHAQDRKPLFAAFLFSAQYGSLPLLRDKGTQRTIVDRPIQGVTFSIHMFGDITQFLNRF